MDDGESRFAALFDTVYSTELVYRSGCWELCKDAHCCHFSRYKHERTQGTQELPLLPGVDLTLLAGPSGGNLLLGASLVVLGLVDHWLIGRAFNALRL